MLLSSYPRSLPFAAERYSLLRLYGAPVRSVCSETQTTSPAHAPPRPRRDQGPEDRSLGARLPRRGVAGAPGPQPRRRSVRMTRWVLPRAHRGVGRRVRHRARPCVVPRRARGPARRCGDRALGVGWYVRPGGGRRVRGPGGDRPRRGLRAPGSDRGEGSHAGTCGGGGSRSRSTSTSAVRGAERPSVMRTVRTRPFEP